MKKQILFLFIITLIYPCYGQYDCNIKKIDIFGTKYGVYYYLNPSIDEIKSGMGLYIQSLDCGDIHDSNLYSELQELEKRESEPPYINEDGESEAFWTSKAFATIHFSDSTKEELYIMKRGIVWKNRRYENYYPLIECVYYFFPDRYYNKDYYREVDEQMRWEAKKKAVESK